MIRKIVISCGVLLCALFCSAASALEFKLPFQPRQLADNAKQQGLPDGVEIDAELDALKISVPAGISVDEPVTMEHVVNIPSQAAGKVVTFKIKVSASRFRFDSGNAGDASVTLAGKSIRIPQGSYSWRVLTFKNVKCPADRKLKIVVTARNFSGTLKLKEPTAQMDISPAAYRNRKRKKK